MLNKKISIDQEISKLSPETALLYTWCIPFLDVKGRILADIQVIKGVIVPYLDYMTHRKIKKCIEEITLKTDLVVYYGDNHKYMEFKGFLKNQTIREDRETPSEIPAPTPAELQRNSSETPAQVNISKDNISKGPSADSVEIYDHYTKTIKPGGKEDALRSITRLLTKEGLTKEGLLSRINAYRTQLTKEGKTDKTYWIQPNNFFGKDARYKDFEPVKQKFKAPDPNCKLCKDHPGIKYIEATQQTTRCDCTIIK
jgi:hypothetical protein